MIYVRQIWSRSKAYRVTLTIAIVYALLRLTVQAMLLADMLALPGMSETEYVWRDLPVYLDAARHLQLRQDLYLKDPQLYQYQYPPVFALAFTVFLWLSPTLVPIVHTLLHILEYVLLYIWWTKIFRRLGLDGANEMLAWALPVWLVFVAFWGDLGYLNVFILMALLATLVIDAILNKRLGWAVLWLTIILQIKPHWAFAILVPLLLGQYRFFVKLSVLIVVAYVAVLGVTMLAVGPAYGWQQYSEYFRLLWNLLRQTNLWRTSVDGFLGYNHSIKQTIVFLLGVSPVTLFLATSVKVLLLMPLAAVGLFRQRWSTDRVSYDASLLGLDLSFALYLGAFIWLDVVWELSLGIVVFTYLMAVLRSQTARCLVCGAFLVYALLDAWRLFVFALFGTSVIAPGPYFLLDPSIYVPFTMIVIVTFYVVLLKRLWTAAPLRQMAKAAYLERRR